MLYGGCKHLRKVTQIQSKVKDKYVIFILKCAFIGPLWYVVLHHTHTHMVRWVVGSILHGVDSLSYFSFQPVLHDWCNKGRDMCYPVCGMVHIKEPLLLIDE